MTENEFMDAWNNHRLYVEFLMWVWKTHDIVTSNEEKYIELYFEDFKEHMMGVV